LSVNLPQASRLLRMADLLRFEKHPVRQKAREDRKVTDSPNGTDRVAAG
jgi:hypothetical protein